MTSQKRAKLNNQQTNGSERVYSQIASQISSHSIAPSDFSSAQITRREVRPYLPGSIKRIKLEHFVTYDHCEFTPGPNMNMVIGPNGTGKSTIVCAIALGLGGSPSVLGRAKEISEFVKHGYENATIEIELQNENNNTNPIIIKRIIQKATNTTTWKINGKTVRTKDVLNKIREFNIQVENLCQFLPQDKVAEFAQLTSYELLLATQKAAGKSQLHGWHQRLIELNNELKGHSSNLQADLDKINSLETRLEKSKKEVEKYKKRESVLRKIKLYNIRIPCVRYEETMKDYETFKELRDKVKAEYLKLEEKIAPGLEVQREETNKLESIQYEYNKLRSKQNSKSSILETLNAKIESQSGSLKSIKIQLNKFKRQEQDHEKIIIEKEKELNEIKDQIESGPPPTDDLEGINRNIKVCTREIENNQEKMEEIQNSKERNIQKCNEIKGKMHKLSYKLKELDDIKFQRREKVKQFHNDTGKAMDWLEANRSMFKDKVFDPTILEFNVKDTKYSQAIENCLNANAIKTFVCLNREDYNLLNKEMIDTLKLRVNFMCIEETSLNNFKSPAPIEKLRMFGFDDYALNLIDGPLPILIALCKMCNLHNTPISLKEVDNERIESTRIISKYIAGKTAYNILISEYGNKNLSVVTQQIKPCRFIGYSTNQSDKEKLLEYQHNCRKELESYETENGKLLKGYDKYSNLLSGLQKQKEDLLDKRREISNGQKRFEKLKVLYESKLDMLNSLKNENYKENINREQHKLEKKATEFLSYVTQLKEEIIGLNNISSEVWNKKYELIEMKARTFWVDKALSKIETVKKRTQLNYRQKVEECNRIKAKVHDALAAAKNGLSNLDEETTEELKSFCVDKSLEELEDGLIEAQTEVDTSFSVDGKAFAIFKEKQNELETLKLKLQNKTQKKEELENKILEIKNLWEPEIHELVNVISKNFATAFKRVGCSGELRLNKDPSYDKWGIDILVKFRGNEKLQVLNGFRQSGGEKSVSTIMYLMAIQELAKSPFRVVDEINQGMDPRNERLVHKQLVEAASKPNTPQYFLITPKLLPNLTYSQNMKVLCIYNGEWQPDRFLMNEFLDTLKKRGPTLKRAAAETQE